MNNELNDMLIGFGGKAEIKSATAGAAANVVSGYLMRFTTADDPDVSKQRDFFTGKTYVGESSRLPVYFNHGIPIHVTQPDGSVKTVGPGKRKIGVCDLTVDDKGIFATAVLDESEEYFAVIKQLADNQKLGWSSGATSHLVERKAVMNPDGTFKANFIEQWPMGEASLSHTPAEPRTLTAFKSMLGEFGNYSSADYAYPKPDKDFSPQSETASSGSEIVHSRLQRASRNILGSESMSPEKQTENIGKCFDEAKGYHTGFILSLANNSYNPQADGVTVKTMFAEFVTDEDTYVHVGVPLVDMGTAAIGALAAYVTRTETVSRFRSSNGRKSARVLSKANHAALLAARDNLNRLLALAGEEESAAVVVLESASVVDEPPGTAANVEAKSLTMTTADVDAALAALCIA